MFGFFKKKNKAGKPSGDTVGTYNSGNPEIEKMKDEFFKYFNQGEEAGFFGGCEEYYKKAYDVAKEWVKVEETNRSYECLAGAAFKYGLAYPDHEKVKEARDIYSRLVKYSSDYQERLDAANDVLKSTDDLRESIMGILRDDTEL